MGVIFLMNTFVANTAEPPIRIDGRRELFIDTYLVAKTAGDIIQRLHHPVRQELALVHDAPWEGSGCGYHTVFQDGDIFRMYYKAWHIALGGKKYNPVKICYAESRDGLHWEKPNLGLVEFNGSTDNNILFDKILNGNCHDFNPFIDMNPKARTRYKAIGRVTVQGDKDSHLTAYESDDAIHWRPMSNDYVMTRKLYSFDSQNVAIWSMAEQQYVLYYRQVLEDVRYVARAVSDDLIHWKDEGLLEFNHGGPTARQQFYTNQIRPYYRAPQIWIGFPGRYVDRGWVDGTNHLPSLDARKFRAESQSRYGSAVTDAILITSRDGRVFQQWPESFIPPGLHTAKNWAYGDNYIAWHIIETASQFDDQPREMSLFVTEDYFTGTSSRLRRYSLRLDGFVSFYAPNTGGEFITRPLIFQGDTLSLNMGTSAAGSIRVEIQSADGTPVDGFAADDCEEIFGDAINYPVSWKTSRQLSELAGQPIRLRFVLNEADVYAFQFLN